MGAIAAALACGLAAGGCGAYLKDAHGNAVSLRGYHVLSIDPVEVTDPAAPAWVGQALGEQLDKHFPSGKVWVRADALRSEASGSKTAHAAAGEGTGEPGVRLKLTVTAARVCPPGVAGAKLGRAGEECLAEARMDVFDDRSGKLLGSERLRERRRGTGNGPADEEQFRKVILCRLSCKASSVLADARSASAEWEAQTVGRG